MVLRDMSGLDGRYRFQRIVASLDRYDLVLTVIPLALTLSILAGEVLDVPLEAALLGGAAVGAFALADALFLRPPIGLRST